MSGLEFWGRIFLVLCGLIMFFCGVMLNIVMIALIGVFLLVLVQKP